MRVPRTFKALEDDEKLKDLLRAENIKFLSLERDYTDERERAYITPVDASSESLDLLKFYSFSDEFMRTLFVPVSENGEPEFPLTPDEQENCIISMNRDRDTLQSLSSILLIGAVCMFPACACMRVSVCLDACMRVHACMCV